MTTFPSWVKGGLVGVGVLLPSFLIFLAFMFFSYIGYDVDNAIAWPFFVLALPFIFPGLLIFFPEGLDSTLGWFLYSLSMFALYFFAGSAIRSLFGKHK